MTVAPGTRLGPYEILSPLGAGGMGEVYRARDTRLGRDVAIKVLPEALACDSDRLSRFEQEARAASSLNHPGIVTIYEVGRADSVSYISMELVEGKTLRDLLAEEPLPTKRLLAVAVQIADALAKAHEAGIVHRDLKPENLMMTRDGHVKILDFGLAKLISTDGPEVSTLPTAAVPTRPGIVLGTVGYMSPEQASGKSVDFRSDQFALGSILYELTTGRRAFARPTTAEALVAIIREEPEPIGDLSPQCPVALRWVIERCLAKDREERYASTRDLSRDLSHLRDHISEVSAEAAPVILARRLGWLGPALTAALLLAAAAGIFAALRLRHEPASVQAARFAVAVPPGTTYSPSEVSRAFSISPDGTRLVIEALSKGHRRLFVRPLDSEEAVELEGSLDATSHFWSPDSRFIAFYADGKLKKIPATGGQPQVLCDAPFALVGTWNQEGTILFARLDPPGIYRVSDTGGRSDRVLSPDPSRHETNFLWPYFLPDGRRFLYLANQAPGTGARELRLTSLDSKESRSLGHVDSRVEYLSPGYLLSVRDSTLFAQPFDPRKALLHGEAIQLASSVHYFFGPSHATFSASRTGVVAYQTSAHRSRLTWFDRAGKETGALGDPSVVKGLRISPDGSRAAVDIENPKTGSSDIWVFELGRGVSTRLHSDPVDEKMPVWSADGAKLFYRSDRHGPPDIYQIAVGIPGSEQPLLELPGVQQPEDVSRDGRLLAFLNEVASTVWNIWLLPLAGERKPSPWRQTRFSESSPRFSPDGRWIAYESDESGDPEVYVALTEGGGEKRRISPGGGSRPRWRRDGKELYYLAPGNLVMAVPMTFGAQVEAGAPAPLFRVEMEIENYDVNPDGSRFLMRLPSEKVRSSPLRVILNCPAVLKGER
jgi:Tol biopolymer transport system component